MIIRTNKDGYEPVDMKRLLLANAPKTRDGHLLENQTASLLLKSLSIDERLYTEIVGRAAAACKVKIS